MHIKELKHSCHDNTSDNLRNGTEGERIKKENRKRRERQGVQWKKDEESEKKEWEAVGRVREGRARTSKLSITRY